LHRPQMGDVLVAPGSGYRREPYSRFESVDEMINLRSLEPTASVGVTPSAGMRILQGAPMLLWARGMWCIKEETVERASAGSAK